jgi:hypothetical protein
MRKRVGDGTHAIKIRDRIVGRGRKGEIDIRELSGKSEVYYADGGHGAHQWLSCFPPELLAQELDYGLEVIRNGHSKEVLLHYRRVSDCLEAHDNCAGGG